MLLSAGFRKSLLFSKQLLSNFWLPASVQLRETKSSRKDKGASSTPVSCKVCSLSLGKWGGGNCPFCPPPPPPPTHTHTHTLSTPLPVMSELDIESSGPWIVLTNGYSCYDVLVACHGAIASIICIPVCVCLPVCVFCSYHVVLISTCFLIIESR